MRRICGAEIKFDAVVDAALEVTYAVVSPWENNQIVGNILQTILICYSCVQKKKYHNPSYLPSFQAFC